MADYGIIGICMASLENYALSSSVFMPWLWFFVQKKRDVKQEGDLIIHIISDECSLISDSPKNSSKQGNKVSRQKNLV